MNIPIWTGTSKFVSGSGDTAFGFYDAQADFQIDADKVANFCARRLGYPLVILVKQKIILILLMELCWEEQLTMILLCSVI